MIDPTELKLNERVRVWITEVAGTHEAEVIGFDAVGFPILKVIGDPTWPTLKLGDYGVAERIEP